MSRKNCKHSNNNNYTKLKDSIRRGESMPDKFFCLQCTEWLNQNELRELWNRGKNDIKKEQEDQKANQERLRQKISEGDK